MPNTAINPEFRRIARVLPKGATGPRLLKFNRRIERFTAKRPVPADITVERIGAIDARVHQPRGNPDRPLPAVLWIHGGGYIGGSAAQDDALCRYYARHLGCLVVAPNYRVAPEHPFPTPLEDCHDALVWLAGRADVDESRVAIGGASAGGGLCAALALLARDRGEVTPVFQVLSYPMLDDRTAVRTDIDETNIKIWSNASNKFGWECYLGGPVGSDKVPDYAVPSRAEDLAGLAPAWIGVGTLDLFHDEDVAYGARLRDAGVPCELERFDGVFHGFDAIRSKAQISLDYRAAQIRALLPALHPAMAR